MRTYRAVHAQLVRERGPAKTHPCAACGGPALDWSYKNQDGYSEDIWGDYEPLCRSCHKKKDTKGCLQTLHAAARTYARSPEGRKVRSHNASRITPEDHLKGLEKINSTRRRCVDCNLVSNPAGMGAHLKHSEHSGWVEH